MPLTSRTFSIDAQPIKRNYGRGKPDYRNGQVPNDSRFTGRSKVEPEWKAMLRDMRDSVPHAGNPMNHIGERFFWTYTREEISAFDNNNLDISL